MYRHLYRQVKKVNLYIARIENLIPIFSIRVYVNLIELDHSNELCAEARGFWI